MTVLGGAFDAWNLTTPSTRGQTENDLHVATIWSFGMWADTTNDVLADAAEAAAASRQPAPFTVRAPSGATHAFAFTLVDLGYTVDRARRFELAPVEKEKPLFRALFRDEVLPAALTHRFGTTAYGDTMPFRWCFAGYAGPISTFDDEAGAFIALDPTGEMGRLAKACDSPGSVDILLGHELLTCVASFLLPGAGLVHVSARTNEVGRPIRFADLSRWICSRKELGSDHASLRREIERAFPGSF